MKIKKIKKTGKADARCIRLPVILLLPYTFYKISPDNCQFPRHTDRSAFIMVNGDVPPSFFSIDGDCSVLIRPKQFYPMLF